MKKEFFKTALTEITKFIKSLEDTEELTGIPQGEIFFSQEGEGMLFLDGNDAIRYRECLNLLSDSIQDEPISPKVIETIFQKTILSVLDILEKRRDKSFLERLDAALKSLKSTIVTNPIKFEVYYPVLGLAFDGLPFQIGNVKFCQFDEEQLMKLLFVSPATQETDKQKEFRVSFSETIKESEIFGKTVGLIEVQAFDITAAKVLAKKELALTVDVINFFSDLIPYQKGYIYIPGEANQITINIPVIIKGEKPSFSFGWEAAGPLMPLSLGQLFKNAANRNWGFTKICEFLSKNRGDFEDRVISSIQWAGKATIESRKEEAFLLYAISLESLILLDNDNHDELKYRLKTRVAHILGTDVGSRKTISGKIRDLYDIRSKIVHNGSYQVTDADLSLIRYYTKSCILQLLNEKRFSTINNKIALIDWFEEKILN